MQFRPNTKIYFIGAGPGDPSLLTIKAVDILRKADVIITDRLVSQEIISEYANPDALIIPVGKQGGSSASTSQKEINELLIKMSAHFDCIVRLKGGDVSLFSNILDELETVNENNISYEIVPGISALSGAAAYTGIPLTARGLSTGVKILTYYKNSAIIDASWKELAKFNDTLVFFMSGGSLFEAVKNLLESGAEIHIPFVVVEQATTPNQQVFSFTLEEFYNNVFYKKITYNFVSPSLVIMGKVASLHKQFAWFANNNKRISYFTTLQETASVSNILNSIQTQVHHVE